MKSNLSNNSIDVPELINSITILLKENKELKEELSSIKDYKDIYKESGCCFFDADRRCNYFNDFMKARKALQEIKEIISFHTTEADNEDVQSDSKDILQIIKEALNE